MMLDNVIAYGMKPYFGTCLPLPDSVEPIGKYQHFHENFMMLDNVIAYGMKPYFGTCLPLPDSVEPIREYQHFHGNFMMLDDVNRNSIQCETLLRKLSAIP